MHYNPQWEQLVRELRACSGDHAEALDEMAAARLLSGQDSLPDDKDIEDRLSRSPILLDCVDLSRQALEDVEPSA